MSTRSIRTTQQHDVCDVCERTLLRGEQPEVFINGGRRYSVCELCKPRALHEGWMREGAVPEYADSGSSPDRRRSLFGRRRSARAPRTGRTEDGLDRDELPQTLDDELSLGDRPAIAPLAAGQASYSARNGAYPEIREPRRVHAIPTSGDHKIAAAVDAFNGSEHRRTVAGVARSLGVPGVNITPDTAHAASIWITVSWELCWYRYEADLSEARSRVTLNGQGYELDELADYERIANATADEGGALVLI